MTFVQLPDEKVYRLPFYLAMEEYVARCLDEKECFFMWQVAPTVIFGRNQVLEAEINLPYCKENNIPAFTMFGNATLVEVSNRLPIEIEQLTKIKGFGKIKIH